MCNCGEICEWSCDKASSCKSQYMKGYYDAIRIIRGSVGGEPAEESKPEDGAGIRTTGETLCDEP